MLAARQLERNAPDPDVTVKALPSHHHTILACFYPSSLLSLFQQPIALSDTLNFAVAQCLGLVTFSSHSSNPTARLLTRRPLEGNREPRRRGKKRVPCRLAPRASLARWLARSRSTRSRLSRCTDGVSTRQDLASSQVLPAGSLSLGQPMARGLGLACLRKRESLAPPRASAAC